MPEGDTILRLAAQINARFAGHQVTSSIFRHPRLATLDMSGSVLLDASSHGKHLFLNWDDGRSLHIHLLMQGQVHVGTSTNVEEWRRRFEIVFGDARLTGVDIPLLHLVPTRHTDRFTGHLGPDLCGELDLDLAFDRISSEPAGHLSGALLDQRNVAGFGNVYAVEVPYICGVAPFCQIGQLSGLDNLLAIGAALIRTNAHLGPQNTTGRRLHTSDQWILGSKRSDCPICGSTLRRMSGRDSPWKRRTIWCTGCQPSNAVVVDLTRAQKMLSMHPARRLLDFDTEQFFIGDIDPVVTT